MLATGPAALSRRGALGAALVGVVAGCDLDPRAAPPPAPTPTAGAPTDVGEDTDLAILDEVRAATAQAWATVAAARRSFPRLRGPLQPLAALHRAHTDALDDAGRTGADESSQVLLPLDDPAGALALVRREEAALQRRLVAGSVRAGSGAFARLLASMSAGVAAHLADLPPGP